MIRRLQLLERPERRFSAWGVAAVGNRIWEGLLRDNKVVPPVLAVLAVLIFAWLIAGALIGGDGEEEEQQASNQASLSQDPEDSKSGGSETPAPGVENRDTDSFAVFKSKDPFREIVPKADDKGGDDDRADDDRDREGDRGDDRNRGGDEGRNDGRDDRDGREGGADGDDGEGFIDQTFPGEPDSGGGRDRGGGGGQGGTGQGGAGQGDAGQGGGAGRDVPGQGGSGNLFDSGGDLLLVP